MSGQEGLNVYCLQLHEQGDRLLGWVPHQAQRQRQQPGVSHFKLLLWNDQRFMDVLLDLKTILLGVMRFRGTSMALVQQHYIWIWRSPLLVFLSETIPCCTMKDAHDLSPNWLLEGWDCSWKMAKLGATFGRKLVYGNRKAGLLGFLHSLFQTQSLEQFVSYLHDYVT